MKLISCSYCGVIIDTDRIIEPDIWNETEDSINRENSIYDGEDFVSAINCPSCNKNIRYDNGNEA